MIASRKCPGLVVSAGFICLLAPSLSAQVLSLQANAGFGTRDGNWDREPRQTIEGSGIAVTFVGELGATYAFAPDHKARFLISDVTGNLANQQIGLDYKHSVSRWGDRDVYAFVGPSLNNIAGTYQFYTGFNPPASEGDDRYVIPICVQLFRNQSGRSKPLCPGIGRQGRFQGCRSTHFAPAKCFFDRTLV